MAEKTLLFLGLFLAIPVIAIIDYFAFTPLIKLSNPKMVVKWYSWIIPTTLEVLLFFAGYSIGKG